MFRVIESLVFHWNYSYKKLLSEFSNNIQEARKKQKNILTYGNVFRQRERRKYIHASLSLVNPTALTLTLASFSSDVVLKILCKDFGCTTIYFTAAAQYSDALIRSTRDNGAAGGLLGLFPRSPVRLFA